MKDYDAEYRMKVAKTILAQLGGNKFCAMTGAKDLVVGDRSLSMRLGRNSSNSNYLKITLTLDDLYEMEFCKLGRYGDKKSVKTYDLLHWDCLTEVFTEHTGMYTSLGTLDAAKNVRYIE